VKLRNLPIIFLLPAAQFSFDQIVAANRSDFGVDKEIHQNCGNMTSISTARQWFKRHNSAACCLGVYMSQKKL